MKPLREIFGSRTTDRPASGDTTAVPSHAASVQEKLQEKDSSTRLSADNRDVDNEGVPTAEPGDDKQKEDGKKEDDDEQSGDEDDREYPKGLPVFIVAVGLSLAVLLVALDNTIIATAIPRITDHFKALDDVGWYGSSYLLTTCAFQLMFGKLYTFFPVKWVFLAAIVIFEVGSTVCGAAPTSDALIIGRAVAGMGSAGIFSGALIIISYMVPLHKRPLYNGMFGSMYGIASVAGPLMGGAFTDHVSWRWCFYINLPIGAVTILAIVVFLKPPKQKIEASTGWKDRLLQLDPLGTVAFMPGVISLLLALQWGGTRYPWGNARIIVLFVLFVVLMSVFVALQIYQGERATVPPRIIRQRSMAFGAPFAFFLGSSFFIMVFYLPIWFQAIKGESATQSGIMVIPMVLSLVVFTILSGAYITYFGYYTPLFYASTIFAAVGAGLLATFTTTTGHEKWIGYQVIYGAGIGLGFQLPLITAQTVNKLEDVAVGTVVMMFGQLLGGALFVSVGQNVFGNRLTSGIEEAAPSLDSNLIMDVGATQLAAAIPPELLPAVQEAYNTALTNTWYVSTAMSALGIIAALGMEWKSVKGQKPAGGAV